jgi:uncharacterized protein YkwD
MAGRLSLSVIVLLLVRGQAAPTAVERPPVLDGRVRIPVVSGEPVAESPPVLVAHNQLRAKHCAPALEWSKSLASTAKAWADRLAVSCRLQHSTAGLGENLWAGTAGAFTVEQVVGSWYDEVTKYRFDRPGFSMTTGHFTQLVWTGSARIGCGSARCGGLEIWVCNYDPPGNVTGQFEGNVLSASCRR